MKVRSWEMEIPDLLPPLRKIYLIFRVLQEFCIISSLFFNREGTKTAKSNKKNRS